MTEIASPPPARGLSDEQLAAVDAALSCPALLAELAAQSGLAPAAAFTSALSRCSGVDVDTLRAAGF